MWDFQPANDGCWGHCRADGARLTFDAGHGSVGVGYVLGVTGRCCSSFLPVHWPSSPVFNSVGLVGPLCCFFLVSES